MVIAVDVHMVQLVLDRMDVLMVGLRLSLPCPCDGRADSTACTLLCVIRCKPLCKEGRYICTEPCSLHAFVFYGPSMLRVQGPSYMASLFKFVCIKSRMQLTAVCYLT